MDFKQSYTNLNSNLTPLNICKRGRIMEPLEEYAYSAFKSTPDIIHNEQYYSFHSNYPHETAINYYHSSNDKSSS